MCMRQTAQFRSRTASIAPGACRAWISLIIEAPAASAAFITAGRRVSTDTHRSAIFSSTGSTRRSSSSSETGADPGRVDSPPMSMMCAPSSANLRAWSSAFFVSKNRPPSENESGVTFTTPMMSGLARSKKNLPAWRPGDFCGGDCLGCRRRCRFALRAAVVGRRLCRLRAGRRLRRTRRLARHDVADLVGVDGFPLEERLGHRLHLVAVVFQKLARQTVLRIDDAADLRVDLLQRGLRNVLVGGHRAAEEDLAVLLAIDHGAELIGHAPLRD